MTKYNVGDIVIIRRDLAVDYTEGIVEEMADLAGKAVEIIEVDKTDAFDDMPYRIDADHGFYWWAEEWFE